MPDVKILNSWKDISSYIGRGVRTVQRWEELYGLPVHRAAGRDRSAVYALSDEIDSWLRMGKMHDTPKAQRQVLPEAAARYAQLVEQAATLVERLRVLRDQAVQVRTRLHENRYLKNGTAGSDRTSQKRAV
jgi:phage terminase Nu1 subunit (DNA packaging protein)